MNSQTNKASQVADGTLLITDATLLPESANGDRISVGNGWDRIGNKAAFEKNLDAAGWTSFYLAGSIRRNVIGFDGPRSLATAVKRLLATVVLAKGNCLEVDRITTQSFCGIPSVTVTGHSRHIQRGSAFLRTQDCPK
jgi:hypothetical protein